MITTSILFDWVVAYKGSNECKFINIEMKKKRQRKLRTTYNWDKACNALKAIAQFQPVEGKDLLNGRHFHILHRTVFHILPRDT